MSVLHLISGLTTGGAERMLLWTSRYFDRRSFDLVVVSLMSGGDLAPLIRAEGVQVIEMDQSRARLTPAAIWKLVKLSRSLSPTILQGHLFHSNILSRFLALIIPGARSISTRHNETDTPFRTLLYRITSGLSAGTLVFSDSVKRHVLSDSRRGGEVRLVPYGIAPERSVRSRESVRDELGVSPEAWTWIAVGRLTRQKGIDLLIDAFTELRKEAPSPVHILIVGDGEDRRQLEGRASNSGNEVEVTFLGERDDVPDLLAASDGFVLSSRWEGGPLVVLEAMAAGLPVVATRVGDVERMVVDGKTGLTVNAGSVLDLAQAMARVMDLGPEAREWGFEGKRKVEASHHFSRTQKQVEDYYREVAHSPANEDIIR